MPSPSLTERLDAGDVLLMDGGTGTELHKRGADVLSGHSFDGSDPEEVFAQMVSESVAYLDESDPIQMRRVHERFMRHLGPWTAPLNVDEPEKVRAVHEDFLRAGADIIITNNFSTSRSNMARLGLAGDWERYARAAAEIAVQVRDDVKPEAYVAAGIAPPADGDLGAEFAELALALAQTGVDVILPEFIGAIDEAVVAVEACAAADLPIVLAVRHISDTGTMQYMETFDALVRALDGAPVAGILLMCSIPENVSVALPKLREAFEGPIGAYSHNPEGAAENAEEFRRFADYGAEWISMGAQIVGGCCRVSPDHISALAPIVAASNG